MQTKSLKKQIVAFGIITVVAQASQYNSVDRWEADCNVNSWAGCNIAGKMYLEGYWTDDKTGRKIPIKMSKQKRVAKAKKLLKKACTLNPKHGCRSYNKYFGIK